MVKTDDYVKINVGNIPEAKLKKTVKTGKLSLTKEQVMGTGFTLHVHPGILRAFRKAVANQKGIRLNQSRAEIKADMLNGGGLFDFLKKPTAWVKKNWVHLKPIVSAVADVTSKMAGPEAMAAREGIRGLTGVGVIKVKNDIIELGEQLPVLSEGVITTKKVINNKCRFIKGSQEAKDHMAKIRAMRKSGGSFKSVSGKGTGGSFKCV